jgi:nitrite reductase/ring-hydroxylating ferredoxin subunit/uncharacterized membrane protein/anti-sigma regulatory factor (Ser/Thr protein kinase)
VTSVREASATWHATSTAPHAARAVVQDLLLRSGMKSLSPTALLLTSELVTNAVVHAGGEIGLVARCDADTLRVEVHDGEANPPVETGSGQEALGGRGIHIVDSLARRWGTESDEHGKVVWFELHAEGSELADASGPDASGPDASGPDASGEEQMPDDDVGQFAHASHRLLQRLACEHRLDRAADAASGLVRLLIPGGAIKDALSGTWLGHPLHPMLTDLPIGFWTSSFVLDIVGGRNARRASQRLVALGVLSALPAAATGASDWADTDDGAKRVGLLHAAVNTAAVLLYCASWRARRGRRHARGVLLGFAGAAAATAGGFLGGHLLQALGVGVDHNAFDDGPRDWTRACDDADAGDTPKRVDVGGVPIVLVRRGGVVRAIGATCPHRGALMEDGTYDECTVTCPWHGSRFRLDDGALLRGPSAMPLPSYDVRVRNSTLEVRRAHTRVDQRQEEGAPPV